jgi:hypothetical protein
MAETRLPELAFGAGGYRVALDPGELLFPAIVVLFGTYYYLDTQGLPDRSVLYARPLLYVTLALAALVAGIHVIDIEGGGDRDSASKGGIDAGTTTEAGTDSEPGTEADATDGETDTRAISAVEAAEDDENGENTTDHTNVEDDDDAGTTGIATETDGTADADTTTDTATEGNGATENGDERADTDQYFNQYTAAGLGVLSLGYYQLVQLLGFLVPSVAFCGIALYMFGERNALSLVGYSVGFSAAVYAVFGYWLNVPIEPFVLPISFVMLI